MFGHQNDVITQDQQADASVPLPDSAIDALTSAPAEGSALDNTQPVVSAPDVVQPAPAAPTPSTDGFVPPNPHPIPGQDNNDLSAQPVDQEDKPSGEPSEPTPLLSSDDNVQPAAPSQDAHTTDDDQSSSPAAPAAQPDDLLKIKQEALQSLSPLVHTLELNPEDKFRTLMMLIQASDDQSLLQTAYETAGQIEDEKVRAQALLDVVNEINYFTQNPKAQ